MRATVQGVTGRRNAAVTVAAAFGLAIAALTPAEARIGETRSECIARYGNPVGSVSAQVPGSDPEAVVFRKNGIDVMVEFKGGRAWLIRFGRRGLRGDEETALLDANSDGSGWSKPLDLLDRKFRVSASRDRHAVTRRRGSGMVVEIMTAECAARLDVERERRIEAARRGELPGRAETAGEPAQPSDEKVPDAVEGF